MSKDKSFLNTPSKFKPTPLNNDLSLLVDIMYYDFILFKMVEVYRNKDQIPLDEYYEIVKILFKKFKNNNIVLDLQTSLKILYIQIKKIIKENNCNVNGREDGSSKVEGSKVEGSSKVDGSNKNLVANNQDDDTHLLCCSDHLSLILEKIFYFLRDIKNDHKILLEEKIYRDFLSLISSLIIIYYHETKINSKNDFSKNDLSKNDLSKNNLINLSSKQINFNFDFVNYNRLKKGMYLKLGVRQEREFEDKMFKAIDNILEKTFNLLNEPYLYSLTVEKVKGMINKHSMIFKEEKEIIKGDRDRDKGDRRDKGDILNPKTPGEKVKWDYKN